jgi:hypothetical protein
MSRLPGVYHNHGNDEGESKVTLCGKLTDGEYFIVQMVKMDD